MNELTAIAKNQRSDILFLYTVKIRGFMRKFSTGGYTFYMLQPGERAPNPLDDTGFCGAYLIWPRKNGQWDLRQFLRGNWQEVSHCQFDTENAAFNFAYEHYRCLASSLINKD
ncbi:hypothetical protein [Pantoea agglomerans]|uniref:hypothetical protein n=1 Tax=Enterobacter agglomerans TaxID=549 RepID=UPI001F4F73F6|nr:hypothetical protein [Pantoea agglomerans]